MDKKQLQTAAALAAVILLIGLLKHSSGLLAGVLVLLVVAALDWPPAKWVILGFDKVSHVVGQVITKVILTLVFYMFFTPLAWLFRKFNKQLVSRFFSSGKPSYYSDVNETIDPAFFERLW